MDVSKPHPARRYNYWLGGKDNFAVDRESGDEIAARFPSVRAAALANRAFLGRAVRTVAEAGVVQFLDIGTGIPAPGNTHEVAQRVTAGARVLYVDNDPLVMTHARALTVTDPAGRTAYIEADLRYPDEILADPAVEQTLDLREPVGVVLAAVLHFIPDLAGAQSIVSTLLAAVPAGSYLIISHGTTDFVSPAEAAVYENLFRSGVSDVRTRSLGEIETFFTGLRVLEPGFVAVSDWRPEDDPAERPRPQEIGLYGAVGQVL